MIGDPTEGALICLAEKAGIRGMHQRLHLNPFESIRKRMSVVVKAYREPEPTIYVKGAPLETLQQCDRIHDGMDVRALTDAERKRILQINDDMANRGLRVLGFAYREGAELNGATYTSTDIETQLVFLGLVALSPIPCGRKCRPPLMPATPPASG